MLPTQDGERDLTTTDASNRGRRRTALLCGTALVTVSLAALADSAMAQTWVGGTDATWENGANWDSGTVPTAASTAALTSATPANSATLASTTTINKLFLTGDKLTVTALGNLTITGSTTVGGNAKLINAGTISVTGQISTYGTFDNSGRIVSLVTQRSGTFSNTGNIDSLWKYDGTATNSGTIGSLDIRDYFGGSGIFTNNVGGTVTGQAYISNGNVSNAGRFGSAQLNNGTLGNTGTITGNTILFGGTLTNSGTMGAVANRAFSTATVNNTGTVASLTNEDGTFNNNAGGIVTGQAYVSRGGVINNAGTIGSAEIRGGTFNNTSIVSGDTVLSAGTLTNSGTMGGISNGGTATVNNTGTVASLTNSGGAFNNNAGGVVTGASSMAAGTVTNAGTFGSTVTLSGGTFANSGTVGAVTNNGGAVSQTAGRISGGIANTSGTVNFTGGTVSGDLSNGAAGTFTTASGVTFSSASVSNLGTISGAGLALTTAATVANGSAGNATASITGTTVGINLIGGSSLSNYGTIGGGQSAVFLAGGGSTFNIYDGSVFANGIDFNNKTGNTINFYTGNYTLGVKKYLTAANTISLRGAGTVLITSGLDSAGTGDVKVIVPTVPGSNAPLVSSYASSVVGDIINTSFPMPETGDTASGESSGNASASKNRSAFAPDRQAEKSSRARTAFASVVTSSAAAGATDLLVTGNGQRIDAHGNLVWARGFGGAYFQDPFGKYGAQRTYAGGGVLGYEWFENTWRVGGFFGMGRLWGTQSLTPDRVSTDTVFGGVYGRHTMGRFKLDSIVSFGGLDATTWRYINNGAQVANGKTRGYFVSPEFALGYDMMLDEGLTVTPTGRIRYSGAFLNPFTETGSSQNVAYGRSMSQSLEERAEIRMTKTIKDDRGLPSTFFVQVSAIAAQRIGPASFVASLNGTDFNVATGYDRSKLGGAVGIGFNYKVSEQFDLFGSADATVMSDKSYSFAARGGIKVSF